MRPWRAVALVLAAGGLSVVALRGGGAHAQPLPACIGDCNLDGLVGVDDLLVGLQIALGTTPVSSCPTLDRNADHTVSVDELLATVDAVASGCVPPPPTPTPPLSVCGDLVGPVPQLCDFQIIPNPVPLTGTFQFAFGLADLEGDIDTICLGIASQGVEPGLLCGSVDPAGVTINVMVQLPAVPNMLAVGDYTAALQVGDQAGHLSNVVTVDFTVIDAAP